MLAIKAVARHKGGGRHRQSVSLYSGSQFAINQHDQILLDTIILCIAQQSKGSVCAAMFSYSQIAMEAGRGQKHIRKHKAQRRKVKIAHGQFVMINSSSSSGHKMRTSDNTTLSCERRHPESGFRNSK